MSQLASREGEPRQVSKEQIVALLERGVNRGFWLTNNCALDRGLSDKTHKKRAKGPSYRKINRYFKSIKQHKKEKRRRKQILHLSLVEYRTQKYIADKLGVSVSTVKRDLKKLQRYIKGQTNRAIRLMHAEWSRERERRMEGLSLREQFDVLSEELERSRALRRGANYRGHYTIFHLDMTQSDEYGIPKLTILPHQTRGKPLAYPYAIRVVVKGRYGDKLYEADLGGFNIVQTTRW